jgi:hypothetical protein
LNRPLLFLDVDGVLNPFGDVCPLGYVEQDLFPDEDEPVRINPEHGAWIRELLDTFDVTWATGWNDEANRLLGPVLNIPALPVVTMPTPPFPPGEKMPRVAAHAGDRPAVWIDDAHPADTVAWCERRAAPTVLIVVDAATGLTRDHVDRAIDWASRLAA